MAKKPTLRQKVEVYEHLLHQLQLYYAVVLDPTKVNKLLRNIDTWSYAHRQGNGELTEREQQQLINSAFHKLTEL